MRPLPSASFSPTCQCQWYVTSGSPQRNQEPLPQPLHHRGRRSGRPAAAWPPCNASVTSTRILVLVLLLLESSHSTAAMVFQRLRPSPRTAALAALPLLGARHPFSRPCGGGRRDRLPLCPARPPIPRSAAAYNAGRSGGDGPLHGRAAGFNGNDPPLASGHDRWEDLEAGAVARAALAELRTGDAPEPEASVAHLVAHALRLPWDDGYRRVQELLLSREGCHPSSSDSAFPGATSSEPPPLERRRLTGAEARHLADLVRRRLAHEPIQYLVGRWDFLDATYAVRAPLLCPRPETEELVLLVEHELEKRAVVPQRLPGSEPPQAPLRVLDVGCGTGCIGISLLNRWTRRRRLHPETAISLHVHAIDIDPAAVQTSLENARRILGPEAVFAVEPISPPVGESYYTARRIALQDYEAPPDHRFDVVVSNPPYIPLTDRDSLEPTVVEYESAAALFGGLDGMDVIRDAIRMLPAWCSDGGPDQGRPATCWMEVDPSHPEALQRWLAAAEANDGEGQAGVPGVEYDGTQSDLFGRPRFVRFRVCGHSCR